jgi:hypothetical protein
MLTHLSKYIIPVFLFVFTYPLFAQKTSEKTYNHLNDTLLIINDFYLDQDKMMLTREQLLNSDTIKINQKGLTVDHFTFYGIGLGKSVSLTTNYPLLSEDMKNEIINKETNYKIIYLKDIILRADDGRKVTPSIQTIKIIFSN